jgi:endogenous inhibitor of DNA gyrase (YacG/DUF329 family)
MRPRFALVIAVIGYSPPAMPDRRCPVCDRPIEQEKTAAMPFCSERCKQIDLGRWLGERYGMPYERPDAIDDHASDAE